MNNCIEERGIAIGGVIIWSDLAAHACRTWLLFNSLPLATLFYFLPSFARRQAKKGGVERRKRKALISISSRQLIPVRQPRRSSSLTCRPLRSEVTKTLFFLFFLADDLTLAAASG